MSPQSSGLDKLYEVDPNQIMTSKLSSHNRYQTQSNLNDYKESPPRQNPFSNTQSRFLPELRKSQDISMGMRNAKRSSHTNFIPKKYSKNELLEKSLESFSSRIKNTNQERRNFLKSKQHF